MLFRSVSIGHCIVIRQSYSRPSHVCYKIRRENSSARRSADHVISSVRAVPYIIVAIICDSEICIHPHMRRKDSYSVAVTVIVSRPEMRRSVIYNEISVMRVHSRRFRPAVMTYMNRSVRSLGMSGIRSNRRSAGRAVCGTSRTSTGACNRNRSVAVRSADILRRSLTRRTGR